MLFLLAFCFYLTDASHSKLFLMHGLNNRPSVLVPMAQELQKDYEIIALEGHYRPTEKERIQVASNQTKEEFLSPIRGLMQEQGSSNGSLLAYSFGGLIGLYLLESSQIKFRKIVLIAPALFLRWYVNLLRPLSYFTSYSLPSFSPALYRANSSVSLNLYRHLFELVDDVHRLLPFKNLPPTLVILDREDELIDSSRTESFAKETQLLNWEIFFVQKCHDAKTHYHHLLIDEYSLGKKCFQNLTKKIRSFLSDT